MTVEPPEAGEKVTNPSPSMYPIANAAQPPITRPTVPLMPSYFPCSPPLSSQLPSLPYCCSHSICFLSPTSPTPLLGTTPQTLYPPTPPLSHLYTALHPKPYNHPHHLSQTCTPEYTPNPVVWYGIIIKNNSQCMVSL